MSDRVHRIDDYLSEGWIEAWASEVIDEVEAYLRKHAAFHDFLEGDGTSDPLTVD